ncbi:MAG: hypothetical protein QOG68_2125 [Solirubrobacteraceae bacterium]|nr:hypothetical protein [Solirubrobacteraceae bacterium]
MRFLRHRASRTQQLQRMKADVSRQTALAEQALAEQTPKLAFGNRAVQNGSMDEMQAYHDRVMRVTRRGVEMPATLRAIAMGEHDPQLGGARAHVDLRVEPPNGAPYHVSTDQVLHEATTLSPGDRITVKVDPNDPQCLIVWGGAGATAS